MAERAIRTFANHLIAGMNIAHEDFPFYLWEELLQQSIIIINLLRASRIHPQLSAYHSMFGAFDFTKTPLAPLGIKVISLTPTQIRIKWAPHGKLGFYVGPAMNHYRFYNIYNPSTKQICTTDTLEYTEDNIFEVPHETMQEKLEQTMLILSKNIKETLIYGKNASKVGENKV